MAESQSHRPHYEFVRPPEGYTAKLDWVFGDDPFTKSLSNKLKISIIPSDLTQATDTLTRKPESLRNITEVWGRTALTPSQNPEIVFSHTYDTIELSGFGVQKFIMDAGSLVAVDLTSPIALPSNSNFVTDHQNLTRTRVSNRGKPVVLGDDFSFTGAYTATQAARKCAANLFILNKLANMQPPNFLVPIPIAIGHYPSVATNDKNACFIVFKVPYGGKRSGNRHLMRGNRDEIFRYTDDLMRVVPAITPALFQIANSWGLTHNQPHPGNIYIPNSNEGILPLLADFSTVYPLYPYKQETGRALELTRGIHSVWDQIQGIYRDPSEVQVIETLLRNTLEAYFSFKLSIPVPGKNE